MALEEKKSHAESFVVHPPQRFPKIRKTHLGNLQKPTTFGNEYLTYILWAISPEGRAINLGEILVGDNNRSKLDVTTDLQAFALIVTAEPYYAVRQPSNVVVLENVVRDDTKGATEALCSHQLKPARFLLGMGSVR